jgi:hypothetical protein
MATGRQELVAGNWHAISSDVDFVGKIPPELVKDKNV